MTQKEKAIRFERLHRSDHLLILPNIWDTLGASLLESIGYPAIATASASIAFTHGFYDGEHIPFAEVVQLLSEIASSVNVPVTADIESGFADDHRQFEKHMNQLFETGIVGINLEDTNHQTGQLYSIEEQCERIHIIKEISSKRDMPMFINARSDMYIHSKEFSSATERYDELVKRGTAYRKAGAHGFYPITLRDKSEIERIVKEVQLPVNILTLPGIPDLSILQKIGVARVSLGPGFLKTAIRAMKILALKLQQGEGLDSITTNEITSDYLKSLIKN